MDVVDCEAWRAAWPAQPANAWSALAFVLAAALLARGESRQARWLAAALAATGVGSLLFHGDPGTVTQWSHDASLLFLIAVLATVAGPSSTPHTAAFAAAVCAAFLVAAVAPSATTVLTGTGITIALVRDVPHLGSRHRGSLLAAAGLLAAGALLTWLGRTGGPWCSPSSLLQPHAGWHVLAASGLSSYAHARGWVAAGRRRSG